MGENKLEVFALMEKLRACGTDFCIVTVVRTADATSAKAGAKAIVTPDGTLHGFVGGGCVSEATRRVGLEALTEDEPRLIRVRPTRGNLDQTDIDGVELHKSGCPSGGTVDLFLEPVKRQLRLVVCGTSPVAVAIVRLGRAMGYESLLAAPAGDRPPIRLPVEPHEGFDLTQLDLRSTDAVVVATQGNGDREALAGALHSPCAYVGMVGSRRKIRIIREQLAQELPRHRLDNLRGPAGLDIGAIEPEEIALSILGELVEVRRQNLRYAQPSTQQKSPQSDASTRQRLGGKPGVGRAGR